MATSSPYLLRNEYVDSRNNQDEQINKELRAIRTDIQEIRTDVRQLQTDVQEIRTDVRQLQTDVRQLQTDVRQLQTDVQEIRTDVRQLQTDVRQLQTDVQEIRHNLNDITLEQRRMAAWMRNQLLKNPTLPIHPVVARHPTLGSIVEPNPNLFPKNAKEFYSLRHPRTTRLQEKLQYLIAFYDVALPAAKSTTSTDGTSCSDDDDDDGDDELFEDDNHHAVHFLEGILGLSEDNFHSFRERAQARALQAQPPATKRRQAAADEPVPFRPFQGGGRLRPALTVSEIMLGDQPPPPAGSPGSFVAIGWKEGSSPPLPRQQEQQQPSKPASEKSDNGSSTNPNTKSPNSDRIRAAFGGGLKAA